MEGFTQSPAPWGTKRKEGSGGLVSVRTTIQDEHNQDPGIHWEDGSQCWLANWMTQQKHSEETDGEERPSWRDKPLHGMYHWQIEEVADRENVPVAGESWSQGLHRGTDHGSTRTSLEREIDKGLGLPYQAECKVQTVQRCPWDIAAYNSRVQDAGK